MLSNVIYVDGLIWVSEWNSLQHPAAHAYLAKVYSDYMHESSFKTLECDGKKLGSSDLRKFAKSQVNLSIFISIKLSVR